METSDSSINVSKPNNPLFLCVLSNTKTSHIEKISGAGKTAELTDYTPVGDAEIVETGDIITAPILPMTPPYDTPTPSLTTRAALKLADIPHMFINSGLNFTPEVPFVDMKTSPGEDIREPVTVPDAKDIFERAYKIGKKIQTKTDFLMIGESIAGGTTTAMAVLNALGYDGNVSSSSSLNPVELKTEVVKEGMDASGVTFGSLRDNPIHAIKTLGDPMMPTVAGVVTGFKESNNASRVVLAGGTQMAAIFSVIKHLGYNTDNISIVTTQYVVNDKTANFEKLTTEMLGVPMDFVDPEYGKSSHPGLRRYEAGDVKEGVGAGGAIYLARLMGIPVDDVRKEVERMLEIFASKKIQEQV
ncbi:Nicotinate-nucleotide-dimethylbenzimidazole phosphoribosyltransferase [Methanohalobium evestigatum Z-7303]|uniref:UPF0284 protein Metev_1913 n=1 Tax=Methanohalobium evestigatum (strain ATCC BAA-1072 / DSM 3721 / NBRC 107634 / OCM 161 / Z-7303) TaxID=644295 RepID=D7EA73_METEZ|nr:TIGR00303 family protein [Methanohalobium evestigatum]ADI74744.1 Nicotinate-nucleotide-dimethylbenzimidazole phosphoribosyltransferase [Methanohalobium evestigatum Z-7303]